MRYETRREATERGSRVELFSSGGPGGQKMKRERNTWSSDVSRRRWRGAVRQGGSAAGKLLMTQEDVMATRQPDFYSVDGNPVYREIDPETKRASLVVVMPNGKAYYADANGRPTRPMHMNAGAGAVVGGLVGLLWGPWGALAGVGIGALLAGGLKPNTGGSRGATGG